MGKDQRGKELGIGISQRKDGLYSARYTDSSGKRRQRYFQKLQECRQWLADAQFDGGHESILPGEAPTVSAWYYYWIENIKGNNIRYNTRRNYSERYEKNIKPSIGDMLLKQIRPLHCQSVLNQMASSYSNSVIEQTRLVMRMMFDSAVENELLTKNALTIEEQKLFLETIKETSNYNQYALLLQTGLRTGEMIGLRWADVDFKKRVLHIRRTMEFRQSTGEWITGEPKTKNSIRDIPLTQEAVNILKRQKEKLISLNVDSSRFPDSVFLRKDGTPEKNTTYDSTLFYYCDKAGIRRFSMHVLRHTFATRCIESGMRPKTLQMILGHSTIGVTMNLYVHVTDEEKVKEVRSIEKSLKII